MKHGKDHTKGSTASMSSEEIALRVQRGGALATTYFAVLVERYQDRLYNFLARRAGRQAAEDLTQEAFVRAWEQIARYNPTWRFSTWLFTIGARLAITQHRRTRRTAGSGAMELAQAKARRDNDTDLGARLWNLAGSHLSPDQHTALWLRYAEDMAIGDIARVLDKSEVSVRVCLFRARQSLARLVGADAARDLEKTIGDEAGIGAEVGTENGAEVVVVREAAAGPSRTGPNVAGATLSGDALSGGVL